MPHSSSIPSLWWQGPTSALYDPVEQGVSLHCGGPTEKWQPRDSLSAQFRYQHPCKPLA